MREVDTMRESKNLEFKEMVSGTYLKTVSAFANYGDGEILFGVSDDGEAVGLEDPTGDCLRIENAINDGISPRPDFEIEVDSRTSVVTLRVFEGPEKPYLYRSKAYRRSDTSTVEVDSFELKRLVLEGSNLTFDEAKSPHQTFSFSSLANALEEKVGIGVFNEDTLKTLGLLSSKGDFNNAAALLADKNDFPGIDMARFGQDVNNILDRSTCAGLSVLVQLANALEMFDRYYSYERIEGFKRENHERIPREAFREAVANALVHRMWDVSAHIRISMFDNRVEIVSPGGLPRGVTTEDYLSGNLSILRNPVLASVFFRLGIIEQFGTGIRRIKESYVRTGTRPRFEITGGSISVILPVTDAEPLLDADEKAIMSLLLPGRLLSRSQITDACGFGRDKTLRVLKQLEKKNLVVVQGAGRGTRYTRA